MTRQAMKLGVDHGSQLFESRLLTDAPLLEQSRDGARGTDDGLAFPGDSEFFEELGPETKLNNLPAR